MKSLLRCLPVVAAMLSMPAMADVSDDVSNAAFIAGQYCDDTWRALSKVAIAPGKTEVGRAETIVDRLAAALDKGPWRVSVFSYPNVGWPVMALMGNRILVSREFVDDSNDDELAFVFSHEMGHVMLGHLPQRYAALIADAGGKVTRWTQVTRYARKEWALSRQEELEADQFGLALAARAGFDAKAGAETALSHLTPDPQHPSPEERLAALGLKGVGN